MKLPTLPNPKGTQQRIQVTFSGINRLPGAGNGAIYDMCNLYPDASGALCKVKPRVVVSQNLMYVTGLTTHEGTLYFTAWDKTNDVYTREIYKWTGTEVGYPPGWEAVTWTGSTAPEELAKAPRLFASMGHRLVIFPDKVVYDAETGTVDRLETALTMQCTFPATGTLYGEPATNNTIQLTDPDDTWDGLRVGDYITIGNGTGTDSPNAGKGGIIREIEGQDLRFDENIFQADATARYIVVRRDVPDLDVLFTHDNRLWGAKGDTIYASKLGDPYNWYVSDGLSTDSWSWDTLTGGEFTGGCSYLGLPIFFKTDRIFKIYGIDARRFQSQPTPAIGVAPGCGASLVSAGDRLLYLSPNGAMEYTGAQPRLISAPMGAGPWTDGTAGTDGLRYYIAMTDLTGEMRLCVYDTTTGLWSTEEMLHEGSNPDPIPSIKKSPWNWGAFRMWFTNLNGELVRAVFWMNSTQIYLERRSVPADTGGIFDGEDMDNRDIGYFLEFDDFTAGGNSSGSANKKWISKVLLRMDAETGEGPTIEGKPFRVYIQYDSSGEWETVPWVDGPARGSRYLPIIPRRCDHFRLRIMGYGAFILHSLTLELSGGSPNKL